MSKISLDLLKDKDKEVLFSLEPFFKKKGLLSGGTSLMLQIPYRKSYDFDIFFPFKIPGNFSRIAADVFKSGMEVLIDTPEELTFIANSQIKVSFIFFPFNRKYEPVYARSFIGLSSYKDIASDKAYAIGRRPEYRDYIDLFIILKSGFGIKQVIADAKEKFSGEFSEKLFLSQLIYFEDLKDFNVDFIKEKCSVDQLKSFYKTVLQDYNYPG
jgi:hypothetical protein